MRARKDIVYLPTPVNLYGEYTNSFKEDKKLNKRQRKRLRKTVQRWGNAEHLRSKTYSEFLKSRYWKNVRLAVLKRDKFKCTDCGNKKRLEVHHTTYKNHFKEHEHLEDLKTLCNSCHGNVHRKK